jgi:hypothetical protein
MMTYDLESVIQRAAQAAIDGDLEDNLRVRLYRVALSVAGQEFHRIEEQAAGSVDPGVLMLIQQIVLLCDDNVDPDKLIGNIRRAENPNVG